MKIEVVRRRDVGGKDVEQWDVRKKDLKKDVSIIYVWWKDVERRKPD